MLVSPSLTNYAQALNRSEQALIKPTNDLKNVLQSTRSSKNIFVQVKKLPLSSEARAANSETKALRQDAKKLVETAQELMENSKKELVDIYSGGEPYDNDGKLKRTKVDREYFSAPYTHMTNELDIKTQNLISNLRDKAQQLKTSK